MNSRDAVQTDADDSSSKAPDGFEWLTDAVAYRDLDYDFTVAVPAGWHPIVGISDGHERELGYTIGFEAPRDSAVDLFADYVMIEILPGTESGRFLTDGSRAHAVTIDGLDGLREELVVDDHEFGTATLDLVVFQAEIRGLGYTVGFYAIGEPTRRALLDEAFELMIRTFELERPPFRVS